MELQQKIIGIIENRYSDVRNFRGKHHKSRRFKINKYFLTCIVLLASFTVNAQISQGGFPIEIPTLKSATVHTRVIRMPAFEMPEDVSVRIGDYGLKSLTFAHTFNVELGLQNAGQWIETNDYRVWQLQIESDGAKSIGLVFSEYRLPPGARLYLFDPEKELVMGAFTAENNKVHGRMATYPLAGDKLVLQYEEPVDAQFRGELKLAEVNHDYVGVTSQRNRWPRRLSGDCNVDVNCENAPRTQDLQRAVCRVLVSNELGTGTLLNNTANDGRPFLISAFHVFKSNSDNAEIAVFDFNYESPFCTGIDGYDQQTVSGSQYRAHFDSLDFMLVELSELPPPSYRPYFAGWDASGIQPHNSYTIHHPNGDTKKISHDADRTDSMTFARRYLPFGHWRVHNWEMGTTEAGSSGSVLINNDKRVAGILTGGTASCSSLSYDAFSRFDKMWNYRADSTKQLKHWLNPGSENIYTVDGLDLFFEREMACNVISNFTIDDKLALISDYNDTKQIDEVAERFDQFENTLLTGVSIGIKSFLAQSISREFSIRIYEGENLPTVPVKLFRFSMNSLSANAMNYFSFGDGVVVNGNFFIGLRVEDEQDEIEIFQTAIPNYSLKNSMLINHGGIWIGADQNNAGKFGSSLLMQLTVCGGEQINYLDSTDKKSELIKVFPNPVNTFAIVEFVDPERNIITLHNSLGQVLFKSVYTNTRYAQIDMTGNIPGIYTITVLNKNKRETIKMLKSNL